MTFKYNIGDLVVPLTAAHERFDLMKITHKITTCGTARIIERRSQECIAGVQLAYILEQNGTHDLYAEDSLMPQDEFMRQWTDIAMKLPPEALKP